MIHIIIKNHQKSSYTEQYLYDPGTPRSCLHLAVGEVRPIAFALPLIQAETRGAVARPSTASSASCTGIRRRSGRALAGTRTCGRHNLLITPKSIFTFYISFEHFLYFSIFLHFLRTDFNLIWNDTTHVQILFINWLRVVVWCCSFLCLFVCLFAKYALRVPPAVTRLTVYRRLRVETSW